MIFRRFTVFALFLLAAIPFGCDSRKGGSARTSGSAGRNLLFITLDTTRSDRLGCYGYKPAGTPNLDKTAKEGVLFKDAYAQAPLTCPSHCSMMTGRYPQEHGVRDNGRETLPGGIPTLAEAAKSSGYHTGAFVSSYILEARFGLNRGFDRYDDLAYDKDPSHLERHADAVTDLATNWIRTAVTGSPAGGQPNGASGKPGPFFCWIHYYDANTPYDPPEPFRSTYHEQPYDGELAFIDSQFGRLLQTLRDLKVLDNTLIVVVGDHGEAFGEHGEHGHTTFVHEENLHVPMFFWSSGSLAAGTQIDGIVELVDIYPTVMELFGWSAPKDLQSRSLVAALTGGKLPAHSGYSESLYAFNAWGLAEQRALTTREWKYISSAKPALYERSADLKEQHNVIATHADIARKMNDELLTRYDSLHSLGKATTVNDPAARRAVESLGYLGGNQSATSTYLTPGLGDPADIIEKIDRQNAALALGDQCISQKRFAEAVAHYRDAVALVPKDARSLAKLGEALMQAGQAREAAVTFEQAIRFRADDPELHVELAMILAQQGRVDETIKHYQEALRLQPNLPNVHFNMGTVLLTAGRIPQAIEQFRETLRLKPDHGNAHNGLAVALIQSGKLDEAQSEFLRAADTPESAAGALHNLGRLAAQRGHEAQAVGYFKRSVSLNPPNLQSVTPLCAVLLRQGQAKEAIDILRRGLEIQPANAEWMASLADVLATSGQAAVRNREAALDLAARAKQLSSGASLAVLQVSAVAAAENGNYTEAARLQQEALTLSNRTRASKEIIDAANERLAAYQSGQVYRSSTY